ncbi:MAG: hypothetical protein ACRD21_21550, partial [Vicinamibacteria bacterium]
AQGFILSRIDGASRAREILALSPMPESEVAETLADLIDKGLLAWGESASLPEAKSDDSTRRRGAKPRRAVLNEALQKEMERILELAGQERYQEVLGVKDGTAPAEVKKSYLQVLDRFHPDSQPANIEPSDRQKLSKVCAVATQAMTALSNKKAEDFNRSRYAEDLFRLAQKAYEATDYWEAIQLVRQAIELDDRRPEYHHLLGMGLMKNRNWLKEAAECLHKAAELDPTKAEYFGLLASVYKAEGLAEDSASMLEKAKALDPRYS